MSYTGEDVSSISSPRRGKYNFDNDLSEFGPTEDLSVDVPKRSVPARPFLRKGARMPVSKIPTDPLTKESVVKPVNNPPRVRRSGESVLSTRSETRRKSPSKDARSKPDGPIEASDDYRAESVEPKSLSNTLQVNVDVGTDAMSESAIVRRRVRSRPATASARVTVVPTISPELETSMKEKVSELDAQIEKFKKENEYCKNLRLQREAALAEAQRIRERALQELAAAEKDIEEQRNVVNLERKRVLQEKDRGRSLVSQLRELTEENRVLKERVASIEEDLGGKNRKLKSEIARLNSTISDLIKVKAELELEIKTLSVNSSPRFLLKGTSSRFMRPVETEPSARSNGEEVDNASNRVSNRGSIRVALPVNNPVDVPDGVKSEFTHPDGRTDKVYVDGRREAKFPSGLEKTVWPDGAALVKFPNGDVKQTSPAGVVTYQYASTGCVQTTHPDGTEILRFASGQIEKHFPDGTKEIVFPNKTVKRIGKDESALPS